MATRNARALAAVLLLGTAGAARPAERFGLGRPATEAEIAAWNIDVDRDGRKLPPGSGSVAQGRAVFEAHCASCHGARGEGGTGERLAGGQGTLASAKPVKTVGSFWPYAPTLFDYIRRAMPMNAPQSLSDDDVYAVSGYVLHLNGLVPDGAVLDARSLAAIRMPNRDGFVPDPRPDVRP
ncbi:Cytochrome c-550 [Methylobacterium tardum]|jgi:mono/diheme cytochrome c family protein|uniref:Cytochrome c n=1 Tax=Methylobacterium tardum TaxID=374432 RepID=A0AA37WPS1_9HYPH|nr:cytochrome c [Methylobacterium tardum]URD38935.1 c-type cytochrome [Methylobacterium tardum]GJE50674.1 Cytochrome c-550 [Methylobacterium tardum]GLS68439.1 cytochrome c [Methylobacterium tardum]